jgi:nitrate/nitrite transporter NarK
LPQPASLDAVAVLGASFGLIAYGPKLRDFRPRHWYVTLVLALAVGVFLVMLVESFQYARRIIGPRLYEIEANSPP